MKDKEVDLPELQEFLKLSRMYVRQLSILKNNNITEKYKKILDAAVELVENSIHKYK